MPEYVKAKSKGGRALIDFYFDVLQDEEQTTQARLYACDKLVERGFGKAPLVVEGEKLENSGITLIINRPAGAHAHGSKLDQVFTVQRQIEPPKENAVTLAQTQENPGKPQT